MITGTFVEECKNRFLCLVKIDGVVEECYVSSSSKLSNYINLKNRCVMLTKNRGKKLRTKYTLQAVRVNRKWILLNLNAINDLVFDTFSVKEKKFIKREQLIEDYKSDFFNVKNGQIVEAKGVLSENVNVCYPVVSSGRHLKQLTSFINLLRQGYKIKYVFVVMNPVIKQIAINRNEPELVKKFNKCIELGLQIEFWKIRWYVDKCHLVRLSENEISIT